jgi:hypothetical protein
VAGAHRHGGGHRIERRRSCASSTACRSRFPFRSR